MITSITKIGNSKGVIIPARLLKQCGFENEISLEVKEDAIIISKARMPREGWEDAFNEVNSSTHNMLLNEFSNDFDQDDWTW